MHAECEDCGATREVRTRIGGRVGGFAAALVLGPVVQRVTGSRILAGLAGLVAVPLGSLLGHRLIDQRLLPACPQCQGALRMVEAVV